MGTRIEIAGRETAGKDQEGRPTLQGLSVIVKNRQFFWFTCGVVLFQLADASMLPLAVGSIGRSKPAQGTLMASAMIVAPQIVVAVLAPWVGYLSELLGGASRCWSPASSFRSFGRCSSGSSAAQRF